MSFTTDLLEGIATRAANNPKAKHPLAWKPDGSYTSGETGIYRDDAQLTDGNRVTLTPYTVQDDPSISDSIVGVQIKITGGPDPRVVDDIEDDLFDLFHGMQTGMLGVVKTIGVMRRSGANLGRDGSGRVSRVQNYYFQVHRPSTNRT